MKKVATLVVVPKNVEISKNMCNKTAEPLDK